ncbi:hypothetical protein [Nitratireductor sp. ZSWI3]|uniref:hypothetical protein n=1 Tax=Nitratireductor sp. ZSWI3 TaxID=2966359 RepID=UPI00214FD75D|nr:hypothetical protein [Nitratireductor sp. ZSWI3]MCR4268771.1 hypothetical protein [Nitratireductor sp. ZSWI3]
MSDSSLFVSAGGTVRCGLPEFVIDRLACSQPLQARTAVLRSGNQIRKEMNNCYDLKSCMRIAAVRLPLTNHKGRRAPRS